MKDIESKVNGLFQTPVYVTKFKNEFSKEEIFFINSEKEKTILEKDLKLPGGNFGSGNRNVLDHLVFKDLKDKLNLILQDYMNKVVCPADDILPYITQSWLTFTDPGKLHHEHTHPNSYLSGVVYIQCHKTLDKISFVNHEYDLIRPEVREHNIFNSKVWTISVKTNDVILFPSSLSHFVPPNEGNKTRISLSFNTFIKGTVGLIDYATALVLK
jgi:uncharacterized protein (TIGR02466 family)|tara:strand:+ start:7 stop:648 length:642 start_codon:yes stop_codon:yes gene_type:complete